MKFYTLDNELIEEINSFPDNFTGICEGYFGDKEWFSEGKLHRIDGPAWEDLDGSKCWYINGEVVSKEQHKLYVDLLKLKGFCEL